jgi:glucose/arabinose dehydrogenase
MPVGGQFSARAARCRLLLAVAVAALAIPVVVLPAATPAAALQTPQLRVSGFSFGQPIATNNTNLTNFVYLPNGLLLTLGKEGIMTLVNGNSVTPVTVSFRDQINSNVDRGVVGIALAPDYATSGNLYILYDYNKTDCAPNEQPGSANTNNVCGRLSRFTANNAAFPAALQNDTPILDGLPAFSAFGIANDESHTVGTVVVAPDGTLFVGNGDASSFDPTPAANDPTSFYAQSVDSLRGKIFHINPNGTGVASNPFYNGNPNAVRSKVFAYGLRNPFRFTLKPGTGGGGVAPVLYIGDVGSGEYEEVDVAKGGENFGWPCFEGPLTNLNEFGGATDFVNGRTCQNEHADSQFLAGITAPLWSYLHAFLDGESAPGNAIIGGEFAGPNYGPLSGSYFVADNPYGAMWTLRTDDSDAPVSLPANRDDWFAGPSNSNYPPDGGLGLPSAVHMAPDGNLQYADLFSSQIIELKYCTSNCPPVAIATVTPTAGPPGTAFHFDASQSYAPSGGSLGYSWDFGDGSFGSGVAPVHVAGDRANHTATLTVSAGGKQSSTSVFWSSLHNAPQITITPNKSTPYAVGEAVHMTANATGFNTSDQPYAIGGSNIKWNIIIHHCPNGIANGCHIHPSTPTPTPTGTTYDTIAPDHGDYAYLEFRATATDADGLSGTASFNLPMDFHSIYLSSNQAGVVLNVNGHDASMPSTETAVTGSVNQLVAPASANGVPFAGWSDGNPNALRQFTMPAADLALAACYGGPCTALNSTPAGLFSPVTPYRLFDTRDPSTSPLGTGDPLQPGQTMAVNLFSQSGSTATTAALLNVTTDQPQAAGYVRAFPCGQEPNTSTVNFDPGQTAANLALVKVPADGNVCFTSFVPTHVIVDVAGWFSPVTAGTGYGYATAEPLRVLDTRLNAPLVGGQEFKLNLVGQGGFPADATAALLNLTVTEPTAAGYVKVYPCGEENTVSNVNYVAGQTVANLAAVKVAPGGDVCFKSFVDTQLVVDLAGWYAPGATGTFAATDPIRLFDTREATTVSRLDGEVEVPYQMAGTALVPANASSVVLNVTVTHPAGPGYVKVYPCGGSPPVVSNVNYRTNQEAAANLVEVKLPADGRLCFYSFAPTDLVVDLAGWYTG